MAAGREPLVNTLPAEEVTARRRAFVVLYLVCFGRTLGGSASSPAIPYYARELGAGNADIGLLYACRSLSSALATPILGRLADVYGRKRALLVALLGGGIATIEQAFAPSWQSFFMCRTLAGACNGVVTLSQIYLGDISDESIMPKYMTRLNSAPTAALVFGPVLGGYLASYSLHCPI